MSMLPTTAEDAVSPSTSKKKGGRPRKYFDNGSSQLARKREHDREAQRSSRQRIKSRMTMLEDKIEMLEAADKQNHIVGLLKIIEDLRQENEKLKNFAENIRNSSDEVGTVLENSVVEKRLPNTKQKSTTIPNEHPNTLDSENNAWLTEERWDLLETTGELASGRSTSSLAPIPHLEHPQPGAITCATSPQLPDEITYYTFGPLTGMSPSGLNNIWQVPIGVSEYNSECRLEQSKSAPHREKWQICNETLASGIEAAKRALHDHDIINTHAAFKAVIHGWETDETILRSHPMWVAVQQVIEQIFGDWESKAQVIACMLILHKLLLYYANPSEDTLERLPRFLRPRPSQNQTQHPPAIDFMFWPGIRERLVFSHKSYMMTGLFSASFCQHTHFHWPLSDNDILYFDPNLQQYRISLLFESYAFDLSNWTLDDPFFSSFPECKDDVSMGTNSC